MAKEKNVMIQLKFLPFAKNEKKITDYTDLFSGKSKYKMFTLGRSPDFTSQIKEIERDATHWQTVAARARANACVCVCLQSVTK